MFTKRPILADERFFRWLTKQIQATGQGSIHLDIEQGQIVSVGCHGHQYFSDPDELKEPAA